MNDPVVFTTIPDERFSLVDIRDYSEGTPWVVVYRVECENGQTLFEALSPAFGRNCLGCGDTPEDACAMLRLAAEDGLRELRRNDDRSVLASRTLGVTVRRPRRDGI